MVTFMRYLGRNNISFDVVFKDDHNDVLFINNKVKLKKINGENQGFCFPCFLKNKNLSKAKIEFAGFPSKDGQNALLVGRYSCQLAKIKAKKE